MNISTRDNSQKSQEKTDEELADCPTCGVVVMSEELYECADCKGQVCGNCGLSHDCPGK